MTLFVISMIPVGICIIVALFATFALILNVFVWVRTRTHERKEYMQKVAIYTALGWLTVLLWSVPAALVYVFAV